MKTNQWLFGLINILFFISCFFYNLAAQDTTNDDWETSGSSTTTLTTNVGIGITPTYKLDFSGGRARFVFTSATTINTVTDQNNAFIIHANNTSRTTESGSMLEFTAPSSTDGSGQWGQGRILVTPANTNNSNATGRMYIGTRRYYDKLGTGNNWYYNDAIIIDDYGIDLNWDTNITGNVGIGTTTLTERLNVDGNIKVTRAGNGYGPGIYLNAEPNSNGKSYMIGSTANVATSGAGKLIFRDVDAEINRMVLDENGNLGIGTPSPTTKLNVNGDVVLGGTVQATGSSNAVLTIRGDWNGTSNPQLIIGGQTNAAKEMQIGFDITNDQGFIQATHDGVGVKPLILQRFGGNLGIGITNPLQKMHLDEGIILITKTTTPQIRLNTNNTDNIDSDRAFFGIATGNDNFINGSKAGDTVLRGRSTENGSLILGVGTNNEGMRILYDGSVILGCSNPESGSKLTVAGKISAQDITIKADAGGADFVFEKDYALPSLQHVEQFIQQNKHLPEIPSSQEMQENGVQVSEMQTKLLQKIEELTLYIINQDKYNKKLEARIDELEKTTKFNNTGRESL